MVIPSPGHGERTRPGRRPRFRRIRRSPIWTSLQLSSEPPFQCSPLRGLKGRTCSNRSRESLEQPDRRGDEGKPRRDIEDGEVPVWADGLTRGSTHLLCGASDLQELFEAAVPLPRADHLAYPDPVA